MILVIICDIVCISQKKAVSLRSNLFSAAKLLKNYDLTKYFVAKAIINC